jgi:ribose 5-phosphate isomerase B
MNRNEHLNIALGSDHAGFKLKEVLKKYLLENNFIIKDFGTFSEEKADYPDFGHLVSGAVQRKECDFGLLICGSGNGMNMTANKHKHIRSALCWNREIAKLARQHNDANILTLPARFITEKEAKACINSFYSTVFEGGRHVERVNKIDVGC